MRPTRRFSFPLSWFILLFAILFFTPRMAIGAPQLPPQWNAPINSLAEKIAAAAGAPGPLAMNMTNRSSLSSPDSSSIYDGLLAALRARRYQIVSPLPPTANGVRVQVTFSEDETRFIWAAQVWTAPGAEAQVAITSAPKLTDHASAKPPVAIVLNRKLIYSQPEKILDFAQFSSPGSLDPTANLVLLEPERVAFLTPAGNQWQAADSVRISHAGAWPRDLSGAIDPTSGKVTLQGAACEGDAQHPDSLHCEIPRRALTAAQSTDQIKQQLPEHSADGIGLGSVCAGVGPILLATGDGDWTVPDHLQAFDAAAQTSLALGQPYQLMGPVLSLGRTADGKSARVVSLNLQTGMYEASIVSVSCGN